MQEISFVYDNLLRIKTLVIKRFNDEIIILDVFLLYGLNRMIDVILTNSLIISRINKKSKYIGSDWIQNDKFVDNFYIKMRSNSLGCYIASGT